MLDPVNLPIYFNPNSLQSNITTIQYNMNNLYDITDCHDQQDKGYVEKITWFSTGLNELSLLLFLKLPEAISFLLTYDTHVDTDTTHTSRYQHKNTLKCRDT